MSETLLIVADSERDADMLYAVRMFIREPFVFLRNGSRPMIVLSDVQTRRARKEAPHCRVIARSGLELRLKSDGVKRPDTSHLILCLLKDRGIKKVTVPNNFPLGLARRLQDSGLKVRVREGCFFPERGVKTSEEIKKISAALTMAEVGLAEAIQAIKHSKVGKGRRLIYRNLPLTADKVRAIIATAVMQAGGIASHSTVSLGQQTCDPGEVGHGVLRAGEPILLNVSPRSQKTGYYGDISRTVVKGRATDALRQIYRAVEEGQDLAFSLIRSGAVTGQIHQRVEQHFSSLGYKNGRVKGRLTRGFLHPTGHGLGLQAEEDLRIADGAKDELLAGHVVTVEPGLYYPGLGGVRLEDVAEVMRRGARNLTRFEKQLEI